MIRLIKAELKKIFHKKSFYIVTILFILYVLLTNVIYKDMNEYNLSDEFVDITDLENEIKDLDLNNQVDLSIYISDMTNIEIEKLVKNSKNSTEIYLIREYLTPIIEEINENKYSLKDNNKASELELEKNNVLTKINNNDWQYFVNNRLEELKKKIAITQDKETKERLEIYLNLSEYRLKNNISYDQNNYLNNAIEDIEINLVEYRNLKNKTSLTKDEKERLDTLQSMSLKNRYILENKEDINNEGTLRAVLKNFNSEFQIFILIYIVMICGSIVSEEFNKGTIKYLLTKPYKRNTILTSKLLTILILVPIIIMMMILIEVIMGGFILGFDSLSIPILIYNASEKILVKYSSFGYLFMMIFTSFPLYLILSVLCFGLSTITNSTSAAITITFLFYFVSEVLRALVLTHNIRLLKAFVSIHWDFTYLVNHQNNPFNFKPIVSLLIVIGYLSAILCLAYIYFNKKDVKNI